MSGLVQTRSIPELINNINTTPGGDVVLLASEWDVLSGWMLFFETLFSPTSDEAASWESEVVKTLLCDRVMMEWVRIRPEFFKAMLGLLV